jgi:Zn-finger nucleic acid-binding protein
MPSTSLCPSCRQPADKRRFAAADGSMLELDLCFACQGLWFDPQENTRLAPAAVLQLFALLHEHHGDAHHPLSDRLRCPHCRKDLVKGYDLAQGGRYVTYRCAARHGRFSTFGSFMVEKGFVRHLSTLEIEALARRVGSIACTSCGGTVDIRNDHACPYCRSALALLDPQAVDKALQRHGQAAAQGAAFLVDHLDEVQTVAMAGHIASASEQQNIAGQEVARNMEVISQLSEENEQHVQHLKNAMQSLRSSVKHIDAAVSVFQIKPR